MKKATFVVAVLLLALVRSAQADFSFNFSGPFPNGNVIPDNNLNGWTSTENLNVPGTGLNQITGLSVSLNLSGGWNGDLYAYLVHDNQMVVLLNRVGVGNGGTYNSSGYGGNNGMNVTFSDAAVLGNIHNVAVPTSGGIYQPDGRNIDPRSSPTTFSMTSPSTLLSSFNGLNGNGNWTLFIADVSPGDQSTVTGWSLDIAAVPEPGSIVEGSMAVLFLGGVIGLYRLKGPKAHPQSC